MPSKKRSKNHHWWPVALQTYWADREGNVSWIEPSGKILKKRAENRRIGFKIHGHTLFRGSVWETNFEDYFDIDNEVHKVIYRIRNFKPLGQTPREFLALLHLFLKNNRDLRDVCKYYHLDESTRRQLLLLVYSLLIRSPANRARYEKYGSKFGLPADEETGKGNMLNNYRIAKEICEKSPSPNQYFVLIHSPIKKFVFGDGSLDWLTYSLASSQIRGRALIPLTPNLCVYVCTPSIMRTNQNLASLTAAKWMVDRINEITQIRSRDKIFFLGKPPQIIDAFSSSQFLSLERTQGDLIDLLDEVAGNSGHRTIKVSDRRISGSPYS
ncbi:MAG: hypothetical protein ACJASC_002604 [Limimaricola cinnabarinus]|jgi:hypothetical protein